ncbi:MAG: hypothetical protein WCP86_01720, partial [bacterium]
MTSTLRTGAAQSTAEQLADLTTKVMQESTISPAGDQYSTRQLMTVYDQALERAQLGYAKLDPLLVGARMAKVIGVEVPKETAKNRDAKALHPTEEVPRVMTDYFDAHGGKKIMVDMFTGDKRQLLVLMVDVPEELQGKTYTELAPLYMKAADAVVLGDYKDWHDPDKPDRPELIEVLKRSAVVLTPGLAYTPTKKGMGARVNVVVFKDDGSFTFPNGAKYEAAADGQIFTRLIDQLSASLGFKLHTHKTSIFPPADDKNVAVLLKGHITGIHPVGGIYDVVGKAIDAYNEGKAFEDQIHMVASSKTSKNHWRDVAGERLVWDMNNAIDKSLVMSIPLRDFRHQTNLDSSPVAEHMHLGGQMLAANMVFGSEFIHMLDEAVQKTQLPLVQSKIDEGMLDPKNTISMAQGHRTAEVAQFLSKYTPRLLGLGGRIATARIKNDLRPWMYGRKATAQSGAGILGVADSAIVEKDGKKYQRLARVLFNRILDPRTQSEIVRLDQVVSGDLATAEQFVRDNKLYDLLDEDGQTVRPELIDNGDGTFTIPASPILIGMTPGTDAGSSFILARTVGLKDPGESFDNGVAIHPETLERSNADFDGNSWFVYVYHPGRGIDINLGYDEHVNAAFLKMMRNYDTLPLDLLHYRLDGNRYLDSIKPEVAVLNATIRALAPHS